MPWYESVHSWDKDHDHAPSQKLQVSQNMFCYLLIKSMYFSFKPYGDMPKELQWDMEAFIGKKDYKIKIESRNV